MQVSKWLTIAVLLDAEEMETLFEALGDFYIYLAGMVTKSNEGLVLHETFLQAYHNYIEALMSGTIPDPMLYRSYFASIFTTTPAFLYSVLLDNDRQLIRISKPIIQLQPHFMDYSIHDGKFRSMVYGTESIHWGIQFSYPQLFQDQTTKEIFQVADNELFPNTHLFRLLQKWIRRNTVPTPFLAEGVKINVPMRLGKKCFPWINKHPQLLKKNLTVLPWI